MPMSTDPGPFMSLAPSPPGLPWSPQESGRPVPEAPVPVAWLGRTSTEDAQDPTLSLPRQLRNARAALPPGWVIVAHFYDVESGRKDLDARGRGTAHERFAIPIPRDGGINDLLREAHAPDRRFAAVICESIERVARRTYFGTKIEHELEQCGVALCAADEPILTSKSSKRATPTLTRRVKQAVAEWYVLQMLELSWDGFIEHVQQGWNVGKPPYGYQAERVPHPVPAKREQGLTKHRLIPDPARGPVVTEIFRLRALERLGYQKIADRLNEDLTTYPAPVANRPEVTVGLWTVQAVRGVLENPKYTGYQVWNRKARKKRGNQLNPVSEWIWSPRPVHEPLVTREIFDLVWTNKRFRQGSRSGSEPNTHPATQRTYPLRSYVRCALCGRRMYGKTSKGLSYFVCYRDEVDHRNADWFDQHPKALWVSEKILLGAVHWFFGEHVFGPRRTEHLRAQLAAAATASDDADARRAEELRKEIKAIERRKQRLLDDLDDQDEDGDPDTSREYRRTLRERFDRHERKRRDLLTRLHHYENSITKGDKRPNTALIDLLPRLGTSIAHLPEAEQRRLYDAFQLEVHYLRPRREIRLQVTVHAATAQELSRLTQRVVAPLTPADNGSDQQCSKRPRQDSNLRPSA
ncbi:recombinase family protein [Streptomyces sp. NPDC003077]|uniref:recombinase family protein n=1 Tax=Streptomyces sp. NPDC003077 TaxID=3154443 RepID=UPI0033A282F3